MNKEASVKSVWELAEWEMGEEVSGINWGSRRSLSR